MNFKTILSPSALAGAAMTTLLMTTSAFAADVEVSNVWARASAGMANAGAAFMAIHNPNTQDHTLVDAATDVAKRVELHTHTMVDGVMQMRQVEGGINVPAGETVMLQPGGFHVMLMGLNAPLKEGTSFPLTLTFTGDRTMTVDVQVMSPSAMGGAMGGMNHDAMKPGAMNPGEGMNHNATHKDMPKAQ